MSPIPLRQSEQTRNLQSVSWKKIPSEALFTFSDETPSRLESSREYQNQGTTSTSTGATEEEVEDLAEGNEQGNSQALTAESATYQKNHQRADSDTTFDHLGHLKGEHPLEQALATEALVEGNEPL